MLGFLKHLRLRFQLVPAPVLLLGYWASGAQPDGHLKSGRSSFGRRTVSENGSWSFRLSALMAVAFWLLLLVQYAGASTGRPTPDPEFEVTRDGGVVSVQASLWLDCTPSEVWALMTDYESLSAYMPNVESSEVLARSDTVARVRQGVSSSILLPIPFAVTLEFYEQLPQRLRFRMVEGSVDRFSGTRVDYSAAIEPPAFVPSFVAAMRHGGKAPAAHDVAGYRR